MDKRIRVYIAAFLLIAFFCSTSRDTSLARKKDRRDQKLFLEAANSIASARYTEARIILNTLIYTYPDSPLIEQAKLLVFYSDAREENKRTEEAHRILRQINEYLERNHPKPRND
jgi:outer membrane protein assembly factor BamD (BamD/ComL family)